MRNLAILISIGAVLALPATADAHHHHPRAHRAQLEATVDSCERDSEAAECAAIEDEFADTYGLGTCELPSEETECVALERELEREGLWF